MDNKPIQLILQDESHNESEQSKAVRQKAALIVGSARSVNNDELPDTLLELLTDVIKPLFAKQHKELSATGRKALVNNTLPSSVLRFDDVFARPPWKNGWSSALLQHLISQYKHLDSPSRRKALDAAFYLMVPPILHQIDDSEITYKCAGLVCLQLLCDSLHASQSDILKKSGLTDVFVEAMKNNFTLLPTLTPEEESLDVLHELYPAYRALVRASTRTDDRKLAMRQPRTQYLTLLFRHQLLYALKHLSTGSGFGSTSSVPLSTFLLSQIGWISEDMGIAFVVHLQTILPLLRNIMSDPFATAAPDMLLAAVKACQKIVVTCWPRIRDHWWAEILRGVVECWQNVKGDIQDANKARSMQFCHVLRQCKVLTALLEDTVDTEYAEAQDKITKAEPALEELFDGKFEHATESCEQEMPVRKIEEL